MDNMSQETTHTIPTHGLWRDIIIVSLCGVPKVLHLFLFMAGTGYLTTVSALLLAAHAPDASGLGFLADMTFVQLAPLIIPLTVLIAGMWIYATGRLLWGDGLRPCSTGERLDGACMRLRHRIYNRLKRKAGAQ